MAGAVPRRARSFAAGSTRLRRCGSAARSASRGRRICTGPSMRVAGSRFSTGVRPGWEGSARRATPATAVPDFGPFFAFRSSPSGWHQPCYGIEDGGAAWRTAWRVRADGSGHDDPKTAAKVCTIWCARWRSTSWRAIPRCGSHGLLETRLARLLGAVRASVVPARPVAASLGRSRPMRAETAIPGPAHGQPLALEVDLADRPPDPWDRQLMETAAHLAALALAADRGRVDAGAGAGHDRRGAAHRIEPDHARPARSHRAGGRRRTSRC